jgi:hypothetical protein
MKSELTIIDRDLSQSPTPTLDHYRQVGPFALRGRDLIPLTDLAAIKQEIAVVLQPAPRRYCEKAAMLLAGAYPQRATNHGELYVVALIEEFEEFPEFIVNQTRRDVVRKCKFPPTVAEVHETATDLMAVWRRTIRAVEDQEIEHERQARETAKRIAAEQAAWERIDQFEAVISQVGRGAMPRYPAFAAADSYLNYYDLPSWRWPCWKDFLCDGQPWAETFARRVALGMRLHALNERCPPALGSERADEAIRLARSDERAARNLLIGAPTAAEPVDRERLRRLVIVLLDEAWKKGKVARGELHDLDDDDLSEMFAAASTTSSSTAA